MSVHVLGGRHHPPRHSTTIFRIGLLITVAMVGLGQLPAYQAALELPSDQPVVPVRATNAQAMAASLKLVNYYPRDRAWEQQWLRFSPSVLAADFAQIRQLGATSVRIIVFPSVTGFPQPSATERGKVAQTISLADAAGLKVWLTLYDDFTKYTDLDGSRTWTTAMLTPYANDSRLLAVELRNEIKPSATGAVAWAQDQIALIHQLLPATPLTISMNGSVDPSAYASLLTALAPQAPDVVSYHYYGDPGLAYDHFNRMIAVAGTIPVVVGEAGLTTASVSGRCADQDCREAEQMDWFQLVVAAARQAGLGTPAPWTMYDMTSDATTRTVVPAGYGYGLFRTDGSAKPAATVIANAFADVWTTDPQNTAFAETTMGGARARAWVPWRITGTFQVQTGAGVDGASALAVSGTDTLAEGISGWYARPLTAVVPGQSWWVKASVRGVAATGATTVALVWLDGDGNYLKQNVSTPAFYPDVPGWQDIWAVGTAPSGASALRIFLRSAGNSGTVYFSNPTWTVTR